MFKDELNDAQRKQIKKWYKRSRNLDNICNNVKLYNPISIHVFEKYSLKLAEELYSFYKNLFDHALTLAVIKNNNGTLENHYKEFIKLNNRGICPFCGLSTLRSYEMKGHEAYDHFLPKETYPTYSVNFSNLVPTCHDCNSIHKLRNSPIVFKNNNKQKVIFPYSSKTPDIDFKIKVNISNYQEYEHRHLSIAISSKVEIEKVRTWFKLYNIEKRYKDELTNEGSGKYWLVQFIDELANNEDRETELKRLPEKLIKSKYKDKNFLKVPFILACREEGLF